ncbi:MAG: sialidase family protein [Balneolaceae bacterium]|nr:sialidase family protein [Balneolaceae bacterium]
MVKKIWGNLYIVLNLFLLVSCDTFNSNSTRELLYVGDGEVIAPSNERYMRNSEADIIKLNNGTLLLAYTKFLGYKDHHKAFITGKKSFDNGQTWSSEFILQENIGKLNTMSPSFVRIDSSLIGHFFIVKNSSQDSQIFFSKSKDEGNSWSTPEKLTQKKGYHILNNDRALRLNSGRVLIPVASTTDIDSSYGKQVISIYFSDDKGRSWEHTNTVVQFENGPAMEPGIAQAQDGSLIMIIRTQFGKIYFFKKL